MERVLVLGASKYSFQDERGRDVNGYTLSYVPGVVSAEGDRQGVESVKIGCNATISRGIRALPGVYEVDIRIVPDAKGKASPRLQALEFKGAVEWDKLVNGTPVPAR